MNSDAPTEITIDLTNEEFTTFEDMSITINELREERKKDREKLAQMEEDRLIDRDYIALLEHKIEDLEKKACSKKLEIKNVPKVGMETKESLCGIVTALAKIVNVAVQDNDISDIFRVRNKPDGRPASIIVELQSKMQRDKYVKAVRLFNRTHCDNKLNTTHLMPDFPPIPIFIIECLTKRGQMLYIQARAFATEHEYKYCWTVSGIVYLRKADGMSQARIETEHDLARLLLKQK